MSARVQVDKYFAALERLKVRKSQSTMMPWLSRRDAVGAASRSLGQPTLN